MVSVRRLRAVLVFAVISAIGWAILGTIILTAFRMLGGQPIGDLHFPQQAGGFAMFGAAAGTTWAVAVALLPRRQEHTISPLVALLAGALGGVMVFAGIFVAVGAIRLEALVNNAPLLATMGVTGGVVGLLIQRVATRGQLPAAEDTPTAIEPVAHRE